MRVSIISFVKTLLAILVMAMLCSRVHLVIIIIHGPHTHACLLPRTGVIWHNANGSLVAPRNILVFHVRSVMGSSVLASNHPCE